MNWQMKSKGGVCDFKENYNFFFKWLCNKVMSCFIIRYDKDNEMLSDFNNEYFKLNLLLDGNICVTDFRNKLYPCIGNLGGEPDEYYCPKKFIIANPILGSKEVKIGEDGVVIFNSSIDRFSYCGNSIIFDSGLYDLISQTATLLADNIISINCQQINSRVIAFFTADSEPQAAAGEIILKKMYAGKPYQILRQDLLEKITVNPINTAAASSNITELVELNNYIIANFFQAIGVKSNNVMKRERLINSEIDSQNDYLKLSLLEILSSWQKGLDEVNRLYGTDFSVELNPALINEIIEDSTSDEMINGETYVDDVINNDNDTESTTNESEETVEDNNINNSDSDIDNNDNDTIDDIIDKAEQVNDIVDYINNEPIENNAENADLSDDEEGTYSDTTNDSNAENNDENNDEKEVKEDES